MSDALEKVEQIAKMADIKGQRRDDLLGFMFALGGGRDQLVYVGEFGETHDGMSVICFFSPCEKVGGGFFGGLSKAKAMQLLRASANLQFGHFCVMQLGKDEMVCARATQILETMEVQEFLAHISTVAMAADAWEKNAVGSDQF